MFVVTKADAAAIRAVYQQRGEFSAAVELRRRFPGIADNAQARECPHHRRLEAVATAAEADAETAAVMVSALAESRLDDEPGRKPSTASTISAARRLWLHSHPHRTPPFGRHGKSACRKVGRLKSACHLAIALAVSRPSRCVAQQARSRAARRRERYIQSRGTVAAPAALSTRTSIAHLLPPIAPTNPPLRPLRSPFPVSNVTRRADE
jgi:hypothetical protein